MTARATKPVRLLSEDEAAAVLRRGGSTHATARTLRWLMQQPGAPARPDFQIDLAAVADYLRRTAKRSAPGLKGAAALFDRIVPEHARPRALTYAERQAKSRAKSSHADIAADLDAALAAVDWKRRDPRLPVTPAEAEALLRKIENGADFIEATQTICPAE